MCVWHLLLYFGSQYLEGEPRTVGWKLDGRIPFVPGFVYIYSAWFPLLVLVPALLYARDVGVCVRYLLANVLDLTLSTAVFLLWPTTFERPEKPERGFGAFGIRAVYGFNHRFLNCVPSVHCSVSLLFMLVALACPALGAALRLAIGVLSALIILSTVLVKQHVVVDVLTGLAMGLLCWWLAGLPDAAALAGLLGL